VSVVSDTGPLIALAKVDHLRVLQQLYRRVEIPPAVHGELLAKPGAETPRLESAFRSFFDVTTQAVPPSPQAFDRLSALGAGEREAILLAIDRNSLLIIDDFAGRKCAKVLGVQFAGTVGVIMAAKEAGALPVVRPVLESMRANGYWLSDAIIDAAAQLAGEK